MDINVEKSMKTIMETLESIELKSVKLVAENHNLNYENMELRYENATLRDRVRELERKVS